MHRRRYGHRIKLTDEPTKDTVGKLNQLAYSRTTQNGIDFINKLYVCYAIVGSKYMWDEISGGFSGTQSGNADLSNYATKAYVDSVIDSLKSDIADEPEFDDDGYLSNGDKIASVKCFYDVIELMIDSFGMELENKADKSYVDELFTSIVNGNEVAY